jgi:2-dehydro-3-deoxyphosphooctonate aldolase (KDO 8-P synthase)
MNKLKSKFIIMCGPNVIENEEHTINMAKHLKEIFNNYDVNFFFKTSFDKANRSSLNSYRGLGFEEGIKILKKIKEEIGISIITDIHETWQAKPVSEVADIIQIPAFLCRQTDLLKAAAETGKIIHVKKGQMCSSEQMHKCKEKLIKFGNPNIILCERGNSFGYQDLVVDPRNLIWLKSATNLVSMDITHCLQQPSQKMDDGTIKSGGYRDLIPYMGKMALSLGVDALFMEVHDNPDKALCDGPTQWPLDKLEWLLDYLNIKKINGFNINTDNIECNFYDNTLEKCILCKKCLYNYNIVYDNEIRGDKEKKCKIVKCIECNHIQLIGFRKNLKQHYDEDGQSNEIINTFNITNIDINEKEKFESNIRNNYLNINKNLNYKILDVGSGYCSFAKILIEKYNNLHITCLEPSKTRSDKGIIINKITSDDNITINNIYLNNEFVDNNKNKFDIVTSWHVLEHLDENFINTVLQNMYNCCKPGGQIFIEVPNSNDELLKIEKYKKINYMIHHLSYWNEQTLSKLCESNLINNFRFEYRQRYGFNNYLNWIYNLGQKQDLDMNNDNENIEWLNAKKIAKNTDAILLIIQKQ